jgi:hypothetical protein
MPELAAKDWTCGRCGVTASCMPGTERPVLPLNWAKDGDEIYCLGCRRELAAEAGLEGLAGDATLEERRVGKAHARIEFEIGREPDRPDNRIAKSCHTSVVAVRKARQRLGLHARPPSPSDAR